MIANHIHDAMGQVRRMQELVLAKQRFKGFSGKSRATGGVFALLGAFVMSRPEFPISEWWHLAGWVVVLLLGMAINFGGLAIWFLFDSVVERDYKQLKPVADALPALGIGAVFSLALVLHAQFDLLFGAWMCLYGLVHMAYQNSLPKIHFLVGIFYMGCGSYALLAPGLSFINPWTMGIVFGAGEIAAGIILYRNRMEEME